MVFPDGQQPDPAGRAAEDDGGAVEAAVAGVQGLRRQPDEATDGKGNIGWL